jgi:hypothetical protein
MAFGYKNCMGYVKIVQELYKTLYNEPEYRLNQRPSVSKQTELYTEKMQDSNT